MDEQDTWKLVWKGLRELAEWFPDGMILIGGVAVYLHSGNRFSEHLLEVSHDADFYLSLMDYADLRDLEEVTQNRRLGKHQVIKNGVDFDVYVESQHRLSVPFSDVQAHAQTIQGFRVAHPAHLLVLKTDAAISRAGSSKGEKDLRDIARIGAMLTPDAVLVAAQWVDDTRMDLWRHVASRADIFQSLVHGNAHEAKPVHVSYQKTLTALEGLNASAQPKHTGPGFP